jgi:hypothetical protein
MFGFLGKKVVPALSVDEIIEQCAEDGVDRGHIHGETLRKVYKRLNRHEHAPKFSIIDSILPDKPQTGELKKCHVLAVMVETRKHPALVPVVLNMLETLAVPVQLFYGPENQQFIENSPLKTHIKTGALMLSALKTDTLDATGYNTLLLSKRFWRQLASRRKILIFQTDSILCKNSDYKLQDFMTFDYIGSKWKRERPVGLILDGGNGGLSLRDWAMSYECLRRFPAKLWPGAEDSYYAFHLDLMRGNVGRDPDCAKFGTQDEFLTPSFGAHQITRLSREDLSLFLAYCEEARILLAKETPKQTVAERIQ